MRFGKLPRRYDSRTLQLAKYLTPELPAAPAASDNLARVYKATGSNDPATLFPMDGNDRYGDCTIAALAHLQTMAFAFVGSKTIPTQSAAEALYFQLTGGPDSGLDMLSVMTYIRKHEWLGVQPILAYAQINLKNKNLVRQCINLFGFVYTGFVVTGKTLSQFNSGQPWTAGQLIDEGHCVVLADYDTGTGYVDALTWGAVEPATWPWFAECVDEAYVLLPAAAAMPGYIPGFDSAQLLADLAAVTA